MPAEKPKKEEIKILVTIIQKVRERHRGNFIFGKL